MHIAVKICGIASADAVDAAVSAGAAYGGLVFHPKSPRFVALDQAKMLAARMRGQLKSVTLIADLDDARIEDIVTVVRPDFLQLHGNETAKRAAEIRARFALPVIKALFEGQAFNPDGKDESIQTMYARYGDIEANDLMAELGASL